MSVPILSCPCGLRMKAKGATPGRVGRCPKCGRTLTVPVAAEVEPEVENVDVEAEAGPVARGYALPPAFHPSVAERVERRTPRKKGAKRGAVEPPRPPEVLREVEPWWRPSLFFPLRGAEGLLTVAMLGVACWVVTVVIPELCLTFVADSAKFGATLLGMLFAVIASLPALPLGFFAVVYALQYLGRVLVSGAMGEVAPPRPPDRNFDGLFEGLSPWLIWLTCGASLGLGPLLVYLSSSEPANAVLVAVLTCLGLPYALMALLMTFLHDGGFPRPTGVVAALIRFNVSFLALCAVDAALGLVAWGAFAAVLWLREEYYWSYFLLMVPCWMLALWAAVVAMRVLGVFYHHHASVLRWHREKPWWGVGQGT